MKKPGIGSGESGIVGAGSGRPVVCAHAVGAAFAFAFANPDSPFPIPSLSPASRRKG